MVLNVDPKADTVLVLCIATSQVGKAQSRVALRRQNPGTIVVIQVEDTTVFPRKSAFDCNSVYSVSPEELAQKINASRISSMDMVLEEDLVNRIVAGVHLSDVVAGELKELL
ncbi:hypothetical protein A3C89_03900 [Candidatus Kaiserbacteria bacterium RIFCSPHIGHO2_02_FULL_50_50]|uniref:Uncharacterized protein n=1 Tax=Candidatus Kaiserbacteria bacterium RIFCSPHIGHO2_02_FULL_50_50 TaxID=1798492 RepID=A0A1F6DF06_9BACT|nr:MAG: hypothetical protein A3C89_03900 [Candidatus Kaiserbacteria bacterium RIFCSPHIGHO2_02_FULL_50_50]OGG88241.1 MAG: hypothetical protein A3G62_04055 [Candidatus Kaiserbacteria bacterium RIFCSPLOWO2_12_FULL_50_10]